MNTSHSKFPTPTMLALMCCGALAPSWLLESVALIWALGFGGRGLRNSRPARARIASPRSRRSYRDDPGTPRYAVPDFIASIPERRPPTISRPLDDSHSAVVYDSPRTTRRCCPPHRRPNRLAAWRELAPLRSRAARQAGQRRAGRGLLSSRPQSASRRIHGTLSNPALRAHISDEVSQLTGPRGVAREAAFSSDRNRERIVGTVENRDVKEVYIAD